jgi:hypothetical protein
MSRTVRIRGMTTSSMPPWETSDMATLPNCCMTPDAGTDAAAQDVFTSEGGHVPCDSGRDSRVVDAAQEEQARLMAMLGIHQEGRYFHFRSYRYVRLQDAVAYARLVATRASRKLPEDNLPSRGTIEGTAPPTASDIASMRAMDVSFEAGCYVYENFHYDRLADALAYANLRHSRDA